MLSNQIGQMQDKNLYPWTTEDKSSDVGSQSKFATKLRKNGLWWGGTAEDEHTQTKLSRINTRMITSLF